jgi:hypothetical protein
MWQYYSFGTSWYFQQVPQTAHLVLPRFKYFDTEKFKPKYLCVRRNTIDNAPNSSTNFANFELNVSCYRLSTYLPRTKHQHDDSRLHPVSVAEQTTWCYKHLECYYSPVLLVSYQIWGLPKIYYKQGQCLSSLR